MTARLKRSFPMQYWNSTIAWNESFCSHTEKVLRKMELLIKDSSISCHGHFISLCIWSELKLVLIQSQFLLTRLISKLQVKLSRRELLALLSCFLFCFCFMKNVEPSNFGARTEQATSWTVNSLAGWEKHYVKTRSCKIFRSFCIERHN